MICMCNFDSGHTEGDLAQGAIPGIGREKEGADPEAGLDDPDPVTGLADLGQGRGSGPDLGRDGGQGQEKEDALDPGTGEDLRDRDLGTGSKGLI